MESDSFADICRNGNHGSFIRNRKMPLKDVLLTMTNRKGLTLTLELRHYMKISHPGEHISKPGYLKQRMKLNPDAFLDLYHFHNKNFYSEPGYSTWNGFLIVADGSDINIPTTAETLERFGSGSRKNTKPQAQIGLGCIYDVLNRMILESDCCRVKFDEMRIAEKQMDRLPDTIGNIPYLVIMDRGYPSTPAFIHMMEKTSISWTALKAAIIKKNSRILKKMTVSWKLCWTKQGSDIIHDVETELNEKEKHVKHKMAFCRGYKSKQCFDDTVRIPSAHKIPNDSHRETSRLMQPCGLKYLHRCCITVPLILSIFLYTFFSRMFDLCSIL